MYIYLSQINNESCMRQVDGGYIYTYIAFYEKNKSGILCLAKAYAPIR